MKIRVTDLPLQGFIVEEAVPESSINARLKTQHDSDTSDVPPEAVIVFTSPLQTRLSVVPVGSPGTARVTGAIQSSFMQDCSLCLENVPRQLDIPIDFQLQQRAEDDLNAEDDVGISFYDGETADLDPILEEAVILSLEIFWHPEFEGKNCRECHKTREALGLSEPQTGLQLSDLLAKAAAKQRN